jgi:splicing factor 3B subunit 3
LCEFHVGETITSIHKTELVPGGLEVILYTTILGTVGIFVPLASKSEVQFFQMLEMNMRQEYASLLGRDHFAYRSTHLPVRCVVDGDLCERFGGLDAGVMREIAEGLEMSSGDVLKKIEEARVKVAF